MPDVISLCSDSSSDDDFYDNFDKIKLKAAQKKKNKQTTMAPTFKSSAASANQGSKSYLISIIKMFNVLVVSLFRCVHFFLFWGAPWELVKLGVDMI